MQNFNPPRRMSEAKTNESSSTVVTNNMEEDGGVEVFGAETQPQIILSESDGSDMDDGQGWDKSYKKSSWPTQQREVYVFSGTI